MVGYIAWNVDFGGFDKKEPLERIYVGKANDSQPSGAYRVEGYLYWLGPPFDKMPWIISNPIYVR